MSDSYVFYKPDEIFIDAPVPVICNFHLQKTATGFLCKFIAGNVPRTSPNGTTAIMNISGENFNVLLGEDNPDSTISEYNIVTDSYGILSLDESLSSVTVGQYTMWAEVSVNLTAGNNSGEVPDTFYENFYIGNYVGWDVHQWYATSELSYKYPFYGDYMVGVDLSIIQNADKSFTQKGYLITKFLKPDKIFVYNDIGNYAASVSPEISLEDVSWETIPESVKEGLPNEVKSNIGDWYVSKCANDTYTTSDTLSRIDFGIWDIADHTTVLVGTVKVTQKQEEWDPSTAEGQKVKTAYAIFYDESDYGQTADWLNQQLKVPAIFDEATKTYAIQTTGLMYTSWHQPDHMYKVKLFAEDEAGNLASMDHTDATYGQELRIRVLEKDLPRFGEDPYWVSDGAVIGKTLSIKPFNLTDTPDATTEYKGNIYRTSGINDSSFKVYLDGTEIATDHEWGWNARLNNEADPDCRIQGSTEAQYPFELTDLAGGNHTLKYEVSDNDGNTATKQSTFMVHAAGPELEITDPAADIDVNTKTYTLKFRAKSTDNVPITKFVIKVQDSRTDSGYPDIGDIEITNIPAADTDGYINVSKAITLYAETPFLPHKVLNTITVTAYDETGSTTAVTRTITVDTVPPIIYDVSAENTAIDATTGKIKIQFRLIDTSVTDITLTQIGEAGGRKEVEAGTEVTPEITYQMSPDVPNLPGFTCMYQEGMYPNKSESLTKTSLGEGQYKFTGVGASKFTMTDGYTSSFSYIASSMYRVPRFGVTGLWVGITPVNTPTIEVTSYNVIGNTGDIPDLGIDGYMTKSSSKVHIEGIVNGDRTTVEADKIMVTTKNGVVTTGYTNSSRTLYQRTNGTCTLTSTENASKPNEYTFSGDIVIPNDVNGFFDLIVGYSADGVLGEGDVTANPIRIYRDPSDNSKIANLNSFHTSNIDTNTDTATAYRWKPYAQFFWQYGFDSKQFTCTLSFPEAPNEVDRSVEVDLPYKSWTAETPKNIVFEAPSYTYLNQYLPTLDASLFENSTQTEVTKNVPMILRGYMPNVDGSSGKTEIIHREFSLTLKYTRTVPTIEILTENGNAIAEGVTSLSNWMSTTASNKTFTGKVVNANRVSYSITYGKGVTSGSYSEITKTGDCTLGEASSDGSIPFSITLYNNRTYPTGADSWDVGSAIGSYRALTEVVFTAHNTNEATATSLTYSWGVNTGS